MNSHAGLCASRETEVIFQTIQRWLRDSPPIQELSPSKPGPSVSFLELWQRIAAGAMVELANSLPSETAVFYGIHNGAWAGCADLHDDFTNDLIIKLSAISESVLWKQFNSRRTSRDVIMAHLDAPEENCRRTIYCRLIEELRSDQLERLTDEYPVLRSHISLAVMHWHACCYEILNRAHDDHELLMRTFDLPSSSRLTGIEQNFSDPHCGGRTVSILTFACEDCNCPPRALVYKPKNLRLDQTFQLLLSGIAAPEPEDDPLPTIKILPRNGYGYTEFVAQELCKNDRELRSFYRNAGRLTAILYLLGCDDCHNENIIAHGDQLFLVDAETLFQGVPALRNTDRRSSTVRNTLWDQIGNSVVRTGLLPQWHFAGAQRVPHDVSALGISPPSTSEQQVPGWTALNTDGMVSSLVKRAAHLPKSLPVGLGSPNRLHDFAENFCEGFETQLTGIAAEKDRWLGPTGFLARFHIFRSRFVRRATWIYLWMIRQLSEPVFLKSNVDQQEILSRLAGSGTSAEQSLNEKKLFDAEKAQLSNFDVPFFEQQIDSLDLHVPDGSIIANYFEVSGYDNARRKLQQLDAASINLQLSLIRGVIAARNMHPHRSSPPDPAPPDDCLLEPSVEIRLKEAISLGDILLGAAVTDKTSAVEWLGIDVADDIERASYQPLGPNLYGGRSGIAVFLAALSREKCPNSEAYRRVARQSCSDLEKTLHDHSIAGDNHRFWRDQPLGLAGSGGILLALLQLRDLIPDFAPVVDSGLPTLLDALDINLLRSDQQLDLIYGCAGLIGPLLQMGTPQALALAEEAGKRLVGRQDASGGWVIPTIGARALTGFSHGAAGMAAALTRLFSATGREPHLEAARKAVSYERQHFSPRARNWPDFRGHNQSEGPRFMVSWCHGAPGIALSRLCMLHTPLWNSELEHELHHALVSATDRTLAGDSLCCGRFGRAAILRVAASHLNEPRWLEAALYLEAQSLSRKRAERSYSFRDVFGFFQGAAGVGMALLESSCGRVPRLLPSILSAGIIQATHDKKPDN